MVSMKEGSLTCTSLGVILTIGPGGVRWDEEWKERRGRDGYRIGCAFSQLPRYIGRRISHQSRKRRGLMQL